MSLFFIVTIVKTDLFTFEILKLRGKDPQFKENIIISVNSYSLELAVVWNQFAATLSSAKDLDQLIFRIKLFPFVDST